MPTKTAKKRARQAARQGKKPTTQAGAFVREEVRRYEKKRGPAKSRRQAVAIGLSEARREGVKLPAPKRGRTSVATRKKAQRDTAKGQGRARVSPKRSQAAKKAARTRARRARR
ncbi:MAG TPA: DUF6496 domain-containing protein [Candidatus Synoicihabitans sp.]|nr:DUF6496 domain-containing protein [Candidatus Synoicihabitans sp.]